MQKRTDRHKTKATLRTTTILFSIGLFCADTVFGQTLKERLVLTDTKDSTFLKAESMNFDINGDYLFEVKENDNYFFINKSGKTPPLKFNWGSSVSQLTSKEDENQKFYQCSSTKLFGPIIGTDIAHFRHPESENSKHVAIPCLQKDSIAIYIDGELKMKIDTRSSKELSINSKKASSLEAKKNSFESAEWMSFSNNGNYIFSVENNLLNRLFVNGTQIDSSESEFYQLRINDNGDYTYGKGRNPLPGENDKYSFMFFIHTKDTVLGYVRTVWNCDLKENGGYYYSGDDNGTDYIAINKTLQKNLKSISNITIIDKTNYLFTYKENEVDKVNVNGKTFSFSFQEIYYPSLDSKGNFAFYGTKDFFLYKFVNGKQDPNPISKYDVRAMPLYISPTGLSLHYFKTDDSTYLYQDHKLLYPAFSNSKNFTVQPYSEILPHGFVRGEANNGNNLLYIEIDTTGYFVFNGEFSKPMKPAKESSYMREKKIGEIVAGKFDDNGFFAIQKTGENKFLININNKIYKEVEGLQEILKESCYFNGKELVFFGIKGLSFYQYTLGI